MSNSHGSTTSRSGGLSLYANLLDPSSSSPSTAASISRGPVVFKQGSDGTPSDDASAKKQQINDAALRFQPTKRPQLSNQKQKPKSTFPKPSASVASGFTNTANITSARPSTKSTLADWAAQDDDDVNGFYGGPEKRQRGGRKRRKKNKEEYAVAQDWDDIYDPSRPNNYDEYKHSDEKIREVREWKDRLYAHRRARKHSSDMDSDDDEPYRPQMNNQFAPPSKYSFAPPPIQPPSELPGDKTGGDAYERRVALSQGVQPAAPPPLSTATFSTSFVPNPDLPEVAPAGVVSRGPVRYNLPPPPSNIPSEAELETALAEEPEEDDQDITNVEDTPRSLRPGQKGFAERLMSKYGWSKGSGLGADGSGIVNPLRVLVEKRKKKPDSEGGGFADPKGIGKIIGGKKKDGNDGDLGKFGPMSEVIVLRGMVDGMDLDEEVEGSGDGGLMQEIGDECSEKYGRVERVYIHRDGAAPATVFVKFTSQLSGLRAVNALEDRIFNGNKISAMFYDSEKFEQGIFE